MIPATTTRVLPTDVLERLSEGSHEALASRLQALVENQAATLFGEGVRARVQYTFEHHVIVATSADQPLWRLEYAEEDGKLRVLSAAPLDSIPCYGEEKLNELAADECAKAVDALLSGDTGAAAARLMALMPLADAPSHGAPAKVVESLKAAINTSRFWKRRLGELRESPRAAVQELLGEAVLEAPTVLPRYSRAYVGGDTSLRIESVREDADTLLVKYHRLVEGVVSSQDWVGRFRSQAASVGRGDGTMATLTGMVDDLASDLKHVEALALNARAVLQGASELGESYDLLAGALPQYNLAAEFLARLVRRLRVTGSE